MKLQLLLWCTYYHITTSYITLKLYLMRSVQKCCVEIRFKAMQTMYLGGVIVYVSIVSVFEEKKLWCTKTNKRSRKLKRILFN